MDTYPNMAKVPIKVLVNRDNAPSSNRKPITILTNKNSFTNSLDKKCLLHLKLIFSNITEYTQLS